MLTHFPTAEAAFLGGSAATEWATESSDLDILVVLADRWSDTALVETTRFEGQLAEVFPYGGNALDVWLQKGRGERRPVLDRLIAEGIALTGSKTATVLVNNLKRVLADGPGSPEASERRTRAYSLSAVLDDLADSTDLAERYVLAATAWREAAELSLVVERRWLGTGKWLLRELTNSAEAFGLAAWAAGDHGLEDLMGVCRKVLVSAGGYVQDGCLVGSVPQIFDRDDGQPRTDNFYTVDQCGCRTSSTIRR